MSPCNWILNLTEWILSQDCDRLAWFSDSSLVLGADSDSYWTLTRTRTGCWLILSDDSYSALTRTHTRRWLGFILVADSGLVLGADPDSYSAFSSRSATMILSSFRSATMILSSFRSATMILSSWLLQVSHDDPQLLAPPGQPRWSSAPGSSRSATMILSSWLLQVSHDDPQLMAPPGQPRWSSAPGFCFTTF